LPAQKRSRTSERTQNQEHIRTVNKLTAQLKTNQPGSALRVTEHMSETTSLKVSEVSVVAEERRKERLKALTRNLEVCDLLDMRNV
jgi:hypothetical protein